MAHVTLEVVGKVGVITLNTPETYNALGPQMSADLLKAVDDAIADDRIRVLLITGAGKGFCSGAQMGEDIFASGGNIAAMMDATITPLIVRLRTSDKPVVTAINGPAAGAGVGLALAGDIVIAGTSAQFILSFVRLGATGLAQCYELTHQLRGTAEARQVEGVRHALQHNLGLGGACVVTLYEKV